MMIVISNQILNNNSNKFLMVLTHNFIDAIAVVVVAVVVALSALFKFATRRKEKSINKAKKEKNKKKLLFCILYVSFWS